MGDCPIQWKIDVNDRYQKAVEGRKQGHSELISSGDDRTAGPVSVCLWCQP
jgi:hypothetical protein